MPMQVAPVDTTKEAIVWAKYAGVVRGCSDEVVIDTIVGTPRSPHIALQNWLRLGRASDDPS
jgi:hypothetical protein